MYRKRSGSGYSKRRTNIYDPQGVYKKGLTKKQKTGMSKQVKLQYLEMPKPRITRTLLDEYKNTLQFYGIRTGFSDADIQIPYTLAAGSNVTVTFDADTIKGLVDSAGYKYMGYSVDSLIVQKGQSVTNFPSAFSYRFYHFDDYWDISLGTTTSTVSYDMKSYVLECPVRVDSYFVALYKPLKDSNNTDWVISYEYQQTAGSTIIDRNEIAIGESMPFAMFPEKNYNTTGTYGRKIQITYTSTNDVILKFNVRLIC